MTEEPVAVAATVSETEVPESNAQSQYLLWKKNAPYLYKQIQTSSFLWPSLSVEWLPDATNNGFLFDNHRLVLGSFSNGFNAFESLQLANVSVNKLATGERSTTIDTHHNLNNFTFDANTNEFQYSLSLNYEKTKRDPESDEVKPNNSMQISQRIPHKGDINRIKFMPSNPDILATSSNDGKIRIFDRTKKSNTFQDSDFDIKSQDSDLADIILDHHQVESWTLDWNHQQVKTLATAANDGIIAIWDLEKQFVKPNRLPFSRTSKRKFESCIIGQPLTSVTKHDYGVNEINWIRDHDSLLASVGEDGFYKLTDVRQSPESSVISININLGALNCLHVNPMETFQFLTGSNDGSLNAYDVRSTDQPIWCMPNACDGSLTSVKYSPYKLNINGIEQTVLASGGSDGLVKLWSLNNLNEPLFIHGGHLLEVNDISWSYMNPGLLASCSADNSVHIWEPNL